MNKSTMECITRLTRLNINTNDCWSLRSIAMTLHRWHEQECGIDGGAIERDEKTGRPFWNNANSRLPRSRTPIADRETGALKRLAAIMARYPTLSYYVQGDPRGASLYILHPNDVLPDKDIASYYSRGVAVYA